VCAFVCVCVCVRACLCVGPGSLEDVCIKLCFIEKQAWGAMSDRWKLVCILFHFLLLSFSRRSCTERLTGAIRDKCLAQRHID
jgi:hypothetical protein